MAYREKDTKKWTAQWFETNVMGEKKKRRKRGFETKREALEFERSKKLSNERSMDMRLSDFIEIYFSDKQNELKDRTIKNKRYMMQQHIIPYFGNQMMSEIKASQIIQWQNEIQKKGYSDSYLRMIQNQLTSLFTHAAKIYDLPVNPCKKVKRMGNSDSRSLNFWTLDEYKQFIQTMEPGTRYYLMFVKEVTKEYIGRVSAIRFSLTYACAPVVSFVISIIYKVTVVDTSSLFVGFGIVIIILFLLANKITFSPLKKGDKSY